MSEYPALPVHGYTSQPTSAVDLVNRNKALEELVLRRIDFMLREGGFDGRWIAIAKTHFEEGFMALNRAVFKPKRLNGPIDPVDVSSTYADT